MDPRENYDKTVFGLTLLFALVVLAVIAFYGSVAYIAIHFIAKFW